MSKLQCMDILLAAKLPGQLPSIVVAFGDDAFLRQQTSRRLLQMASIDIEQARTFDGQECDWRDVHDELATVSLFDPNERRVAILKQADDLVKAARQSMEKWFASAVPLSLLLMEVNTFPSSTKLYKSALEKGWCIECSSPKGKTAEDWIKKWAWQMHQLKLSAAQVGFILDRVGAECGLLDQELAKATLYAESDGSITDDRLKQAIGSWRTQTVWEITAAAIDGRAAQALEQLHKVVQAGESAFAIVPQMSWSLRRFGVATQLIAQNERHGGKVNLREALARAGFRPFELGTAENQLRRLGRARGLQLLTWLLELDLKLKLSHSKEERGILALEEFIVRLAS